MRFEAKTLILGKFRFWANFAGFISMGTLLEDGSKSFGSCTDVECSLDVLHIFFI